ncbi:GNAT family N-acetyltransferase, partial [Bacillus mycoides]|nr:GNAT family N-acetyltransferase [Bacillus mycoides]
VQLTTDKERQEALHFYKKLGFKDSHEGLKLFL